MDDQVAFLGKWRFSSKAIVLIAVLLCYFPSIRGDFLLDDHVLVEKNAFIQELKAPHL